MSDSHQELETRSMSDGGTGAPDASGRAGSPKPPLNYDTAAAPTAEPAVNAAPAAPAPGKTPSRPASTLRWPARQLATMALFSALVALLGFIQVPIFPPATLFGITYDASNVPMAMMGFAFGPGAGSLVCVLGSLIYGILKGDYVGALMNIVIGLAFVLPAALICRRKKSAGRVASGLGLGCVVSIAAAIPLNLVIWPLFFHMPLEETMTYIVPLMLPFNALKAILNAILAFALFQSLRWFIAPGAGKEAK
jgi:riboflavin transporter FmnP